MYTVEFGKWEAVGVLWEPVASICRVETLRQRETETRKLKLNIALEQAMTARGRVKVSSTLSVTSALDGVGVNATPRPFFSRGRDPVPIVWEAW